MTLHRVVLALGLVLGAIASPLAALAQSSPVQLETVYGGGVPPTNATAFAVALIKSTAAPRGEVFCRAILSHYRAPPGPSGALRLYWPVPNEASLRPIAPADCGQAAVTGGTPFYDYGAADYLLSRLQVPTGGPVLVAVSRGPDGCLKELGFLDMTQTNPAQLAARLSWFDGYLRDPAQWTSGLQYSDAPIIPGAGVARGIGHGLRQSLVAGWNAMTRPWAGPCWR